MSEELKIDDIAEVVKSHVEDKADKAEMEAIKTAVEAIEVPSVEGFVKEEALAESAEKIKSLEAAIDELDAVVKSAPALITKENPVMETWKWDSEGFNAKSTIDLGEMITKQYTPTTRVTGEPTSTARLYYTCLLYTSDAADE